MVPGRGMHRRVGSDLPCHLSAGKCLGQVQSAVVPAMLGSVQGKRDKGHSIGTGTAPGLLLGWQE